MASARKRGKTWMAIFRDADGHQRSAGTYSTKKAALNAAKLAEAGMMPVKTVAVYSKTVRGKITVAAYAPGWLPSHPMAPHARYVYEQVIRCHILPALGVLVLADVTTADVRGLFRPLEAQGTSQALGKKIKTVLSAMFQCGGRGPADPGQPRAWRAVPGGPAEAQTGADGRRVAGGAEVPHGRVPPAGRRPDGHGRRIEEIMAMETTDITDGVWHVQRVRNQVDGEFTTRDKTKTGRTGGSRSVPSWPSRSRPLARAGCSPTSGSTPTASASGTRRARPPASTGVPPRVTYAGRSPR